MTLSIPRLARTSGPLPLSFAQERMWIMDQLTHGLPTFTTPMAIRLRGPLQHGALAWALTEIVRRHEVLRTTVRAPNGTPYQFISAPHRLEPPLRDLTRLPADRRESVVLDLLGEEARVPLDPAERVIRARLYRLAPDDHILYLAVHHIAWDGWSTGVFNSELSQLYGHRLCGTAPDLPDLPVGYADYALWQRSQEGSSDMAEHLAYWLNELGDGVPALDLPSDRPRSMLKSTRADVEEYTVDAECVQRFRTFAQAQRVSIAMLVSAGLHAALHRCTGQAQVATGFPAANRSRPETENLIGFFVNALVLKTDSSAETTFGELLRQVRAKTLSAIRHEDLPFEQMVAALGVERDPSRNPLVQVSLAFQYGTDARLLSLPGLETEFIELHNGTAQDDIGLFAWEKGDALVLATEFRTDLYDAETPGRLLRHTARMIELGCREPGRPLSDLPLLTDGERTELLRVATGPTPDTAFDPLHRLVERRAAAAPGTTAVLDETGTLAYGWLNARANRLARHLRGRGVRPHTCVAIALERSADSLVAILAVLKLGGHYVPLDPTLPSARQAFVVADTDPVAVVTNGELRFRLPQVAVPVVALDEEAGEIARQPAHDLDVAVDADDVAYIIYTSGSSGRPKGVVVPHKGATNLIRSLQDELALATTDRVLHGVPITFDTSVAEMFWPLAYGATVVIAAPHTPYDPSALADLLARARVTVTFLVPSILSAYLAAQPPPIPQWRVMMCNGEAFEPGLLRRFRDYAPQARIFNGYGPTETSIGVTRYEIPAEGEVAAIVPIGPPMAGTQCHVLDACLQPAPMGARGELCIGGVGVTYGYRNGPQLTAEKFVPDPFGGVAGARLYRTGDVVRWNREGFLEFLGRADDQIKLSGVRVEPGEIQAVLERVPEVAAARVVVGEEGGRQVLTAYLVTEGGRTPDLRRLRAHAAAELPRLLVPSRFVTLDGFPLTSSGKLDVHRLPRPDPAITGPREDDHTAPRTADERVVADHIAAILGEDRVGPYDDFFALGGNSLEGARLIFELRRVTGVEITLRDLFQASSVLALAGVMAERRRSAADAGGRDPLIRLSDGAHRSIYLVHPVSGSGLCYAGLAKELEDTISVGAFQAPGLEDDRPPLGTVGELAATYVRALRAHEPHGPYLIGGWSMGGLVALEMARSLREEGEPIERLVLIDPTSPSGSSADFSHDELARMFAQDAAAATGQRLDTTHDELMRRRTNVYGANARAIGRYRINGSYGGEVTILHPVTSSSPSEWAAHLDGPVDLRPLPGDHYSLFHGPNLRVLAEQIVACLASAGVASSER